MIKTVKPLLSDLLDIVLSQLTLSSKKCRVWFGGNLAAISSKLCCYITPDFISVSDHVETLDWLQCVVQRKHFMGEWLRECCVMYKIDFWYFLSSVKSKPRY